MRAIVAICILMHCVGAHAQASKQTFPVSGLLSAYGQETYNSPGELKLVATIRTAGENALFDAFRAMQEALAWFDSNLKWPGLDRYTDAEGKLARVIFNLEIEDAKHGVQLVWEPAYGSVRGLSKLSPTDFVERLRYTGANTLGQVPLFEWCDDGGEKLSPVFCSYAVREFCYEIRPAPQRCDIHRTAGRWAR